MTLTTCGVCGSGEQSGRHCAPGSTLLKSPGYHLYRAANVVPTTSDTLRGVADMLDCLAQLDTDAGRTPLGDDVTYSAGGVALHLPNMLDWRPRAESILGELGGFWTPRHLDMSVCLTSYVRHRHNWREAGTVHVYVPRFTLDPGAQPPLTDLSDLPGLVTT